MMLIFRTTELRAANPAELRTISAESPTANVRKLQSTENPALQIRVLQIVDPATGAPMQILEFILVMPQDTGSPSQSI
jgi:hypothetical protein